MFTYFFLLFHSSINAEHNANPASYMNFHLVLYPFLGLQIIYFVPTIGIWSIVIWDYMVCFKSFPSVSFNWTQFELEWNNVDFCVVASIFIPTAVSNPADRSAMILKIRENSASTAVIQSTKPNWNPAITKTLFSYWSAQQLTDFFDF